MVHTLYNLLQTPMVLTFALLTLLGAANASSLAIRQEECQTGDIKCCNIVTMSNDSVLGPMITGAFGAQVNEGTPELVGISCTSIDNMGANKAEECRGERLCCAHRDFTGRMGLVSVGCIPITQ